MPDAAPAELRTSGRPPREASTPQSSRGVDLRALGIAVLASAVLLTGLLPADSALAQARPGAPTNLTATALAGGTQVRLDFVATSGLPASGQYRVRAEGGSYGAWTNFTTTPFVNANGAGVVTGLLPDTDYTFLVRLKNSSGTGARSNEATVRTLTPAGAPGAPTNLTATALAGGTQVRLDFVATSGLPASGQYRVRAEGGSYGAWTNFTITSFVNANGAGVVTGLLPDTDYTFQVRLKNSSGTGARSNEATVRTLTPAGAPGAPTNLTATALAGGTQVRLDFVATSGLPASGQYRVRAEGGSYGAWTNFTTTPFVNANGAGVVTGLLPDTDYTFLVRLKNSSGTGARSNEATVRTLTPAGAPGAPTNLTATALAGGTQVRLDFVATSGLPASGQYRVRAEGGSYGAWTNFTTTPFVNANGAGVVTGLLPDTDYTFQVRLKNSSGTGARSNETTVRTQGPPGAPRGLSAKAVSTTQIDLNWAAPSKTGGSDITGYAIEVSTDNGVNWSELVADTSSTETAYSHTGLSSGDTRRYRVSAINANGTGPASEEASATIAVPGTPGGLKATAGNKQVSLVWNAAPSNGSHSITKYQVRHAQGSSVPSGTGWTDVDGGEGARTHTVKSLANDSEYTFEVRAVNGVGAGSAGTVKATPKLVVSLTYRFHVTTTSIKRGLDRTECVRKLCMSARAGGYVGVVRDDDPDTLEGGETVESDTTFALTWNGRPTDELHPDNPTSVTIKAGQRGARFSLKAAADDDDPRVYNQPVKADVVATLGDLELRDRLIVRDDDPLPTASVSVPETVAEGDAFRVTAMLTHRLDVDTSVPIVIHNPSNMTLEGMDGPYTTIGIPAGEISGETGDIRKQEDSDEDGYGELFAGINGISPYQWRSSWGTVKMRVTDDDTDNPGLRRYAGWPRLYVGDVNATESGDPGTVTKMKFPVTLYPTSRDTATVDYRTEDGSAKAGVNYVAKSGTLTFAPREKTKTVEVDVLDDGVGQHPTFRLVLTGPRGGGAEVRTYTVTGRIYDETPTFISYDESAHESGSGADADMTFLVKLKYADENKTYTVDYRTEDGTARAGSDYTATRGTLTFTPGERGWNEVTVPVLDDQIQDSGETFSLVLSNPSEGAQLHAWKSTVTGTIRNDDAQGVSASFPDSASMSSSHSGVDDRPQVVVAFSEAVAYFSADTPSVAVTGATVSSVQAHTEEGLENAWAFVLAPDGDGEVTFALLAEAACASGGICTDGGTELTQVPVALTLPGPVAAGDDDDDAAAAALTASFPESRFASALHKGADDRPQVVVAFSEAVASIAADTPSVAVTGATVSSVQAHTEDGLENAWIFFLDPDGGR